MDLFCYLFLMFVFVVLSCLFLAALWSPAGKGLTIWPFLCVVLSCVFVTFPYCVPGQVWYLIVSIPDLCLPLYIYYPFKIENNKDPDQTVLIMHRLGAPLLLASSKK